MVNNIEFKFLWATLGLNLLCASSANLNGAGGDSSNNAFIEDPSMESDPSNTAPQPTPDSPTSDLGPVDLGFNHVPQDMRYSTFRLDGDDPENPENDPNNVWYPSDTYSTDLSEDSVSKWEAVVVGNQHIIEIWDEFKDVYRVEVPKSIEGDSQPSPPEIYRNYSALYGSPYVELHSHFESHGVKQQFQMNPGRNLSFILCYKGRYEGEFDNEFALKVEGAWKVKVDGSELQASDGVMSQSFMVGDDYSDTGNPQYTSWQYVPVSIVSDPGEDEPIDITLSLETPEDANTFSDGSETEPWPTTYGAFVDLFKVELDPVSKLKADDLDPNGPLNQIVNPGGIVIESSPDNDNVAVFEVFADMSDEMAMELLHWEIDDSSVGSVSFYPPDDENNNKGKTVKINGDTNGTGRVKINVYAGDPNASVAPVVYAEAYVVEPKAIPYRANIVTYEPDVSIDDFPFYPNVDDDIYDGFSIANIILRQAGIRLEQSDVTTDGNVENGSIAGGYPSASWVEAKLIDFTREVSSGNHAKALSINYLSGLFQISFIASLDEEANGVNLLRKRSGISGDSASESYMTSLGDVLDGSIAHTLEIGDPNSNPNYPGLYGVLICYYYADDIYKVGRTIAHELAHAANVKHRFGNLQSEEGGGLDSLESQTQYDKILLGSYGTNLMDYGTETDLGEAVLGGVDLDLLQVEIIQESPLY